MFDPKVSFDIPPLAGDEVQTRRAGDVEGRIQMQRDFDAFGRILLPDKRVRSSQNVEKFYDLIMLLSE